MVSRLSQHVESLNLFMKNTSQFIGKSAEPGGHYTAVWMRDASFILRDQFFSGYISQTINELKYIWSGQIDDKTTRLIHGRGAPSQDFNPVKCNSELIKKYYGALPTTIYSSFSEIYSIAPDIDSTALMIYTTSWILLHLYKTINPVKKYNSFYLKTDHEEGYLKSEFSKLTGELVPRMFRAVQYLMTKDIDNDGILEQNPNEDWMDTALRDGKIVYSQGSWILALKYFVLLLHYLERYDETKRLERIMQNSISSIEKELWSDKEKCYVDKTYHDKSYYVENMVTQDSLLYAFALITDDYFIESNSLVDSDNDSELHKISKESMIKCNKMLQSVKKKIWNNQLPTITEKPLLKTGPYIHKPYNYHNHTFWPWITGIELMTRIRFNQLDECEKILSKILANANHNNLLFEWVNPITHMGYGAYPFRTGISSLRLVIFDIFRTLGLKIDHVEIGQ